MRFTAGRLDSTSGEKLVENQAEIVVHERSDRKNSRRVDSRAHNFQADLVFGGDDDVLVFGLVAGGVAVGAELHVGGDGMVRDEARKRSDLSEDADLVDLLHDSIEHLAFEGPEHDRLVLHRINHKTLASLNNTSSDVVDGSDRDDKSVFSRAGAFDFCIQLLSDGV